MIFNSKPTSFTLKHISSVYLPVVPVQEEVSLGVGGPAQGLAHNVAELRRTSVETHTDERQNHDMWLPSYTEC